MLYNYSSLHQPQINFIGLYHRISQTFIDVGHKLLVQILGPKKQ